MRKSSQTWPYRKFQVSLGYLRSRGKQSQPSQNNKALRIIVLIVSAASKKEWFKHSWKANKAVPKTLAHSAPNKDC